jgi:hypothetical protein
VSMFGTLTCASKEVETYRGGGAAPRRVARGTKVRGVFPTRSKVPGLLSYADGRGVKEMVRGKTSQQLPGNEVRSMGSP